MRAIAQLLWIILLASCGGGGDASTPAAPMPAAAPVAPPPAPIAADIAVLMMGNSHTSVNRLPDTLATMLRAGHPGKTVVVTVAPGYLFLDERLAHGPSVAQLQRPTLEPCRPAGAEVQHFRYAQLLDSRGRATDPHGTRFRCSAGHVSRVGATRRRLKPKRSTTCTCRSPSPNLPVSHRSVRPGTGPSYAIRH